MISDTDTKRVYASGTIFYNDCRSLERTLDSLKDKMDYMICVDGRFKHFDEDAGHDKGVSTDGSRELVKSYDNAILVGVPNAFEIQKRQAYVDWCSKLANPADYLLIIDSDEYILEWEPTTFKGHCLETCESNYYDKYNIFSVMVEINQPNYDHIVHKITGSNPPQIVQGDDRQFAHHPRLWHRPWEVQYNVTHYNFINKDPKKESLNNCETMASVAIIPGIKLGHDHTLRNPDFLKKREGYQKHLVEFEQKKLRQFMQKHKQKPPLEMYDKIDASPVEKEI